MKITGVFKGQGCVCRCPERRLLKLIGCPFKVRGKVGPEKQFASVLRLVGQKFKKGWLNQSPFMVSVLRPRIGKHQIGVVDLNLIREV